MAAFSQVPGITVSPGTEISSGDPADPHFETFLAINPRNPKNLLATSLVIGDGRLGSVVYASFDGGKTWKRARTTSPDNPIFQGGDPIVYFDPQGTAFFGSIQPAPVGFVLGRSADGGLTWGPPVTLPGGPHDRECRQRIVRQGRLLELPGARGQYARTQAELGPEGNPMEIFRRTARFARQIFGVSLSDPRKGKMKQLILTCVLCLAFQPAIAFAQANRTRVGPNLRVSQAESGDFMREVLLSADPADPNHLLGCGIAVPETQGEQADRVTAYLSMDRGKTWQRTLQTAKNSGDPACALGRDGLAILVAIQVFPDRLAKHPLFPGEPHYVLAVYRSTDGGRTWSQPQDLPMNFQSIDRESVTIDTTTGKYKNAVYISGTSDVKDLAGKWKNGFGVWVSRDGGKTFLGPLKRADADDHYVLCTGNSVVLSDGTLVSLFGDLKKSNGGMAVEDSSPGNPNAALLSVRTEAGGESLSQAVQVANLYLINLWAKNGTPPSDSIPTLAVNSTGGPFKDRLYAVWADNRDGRGAIRFSYSADKGKTWSKSVVMDDVPGPVTEKAAPDNFQPTVAVNEAGVVLVTWYDRRDNPDGLGWYLRARASLDGGETWLPSVRVSTQPNIFSPQTKLFVGGFAQNPKAGPDGETSVNPIHVSVMFNIRQFMAGDYAGLAADAGGTFHAFWIDDRTGTPQLWTAPILVDGTAVLNGDSSLAKLKDVSPDVQLKIFSTNYDRASGTVSVEARLKNTSDKTLFAPIKLRLLDLTSSLGTPSAANADNDVAGSDVLWDLSSLLKGGRLEPKKTSATMRLIFRVSDPRPFFNGKVIRTLDLLEFNARVLAGGEEAAKSTPKK